MKVELVRRALKRCVELSRSGRHKKAVEEVERAFPVAEGHPDLEGELLIWKAQALLTMGRPEEAVPAAEAAWELAPSPHACYLTGCALADLGELEEAEKMLTLGGELFPEAPHLKVRLAMLLTEQARLPEALDLLEEIELGDEVVESLALFTYGLRANILGVLRRWTEAEEQVSEGLDRFPGNRLLEETGLSIAVVRRRAEAGDSLARTWAEELVELEQPAAADVDDAICEVGRALGTPKLAVLAGRRLWRAFLEADPVRPTAAEAWALAAILAVTRLDGLSLPVGRASRAVRVSKKTVGSALRRIRAFLDGLEPEFARRQFAAMENPRLEEQPGNEGRRDARSPGTVVRFPTGGSKGEES